MSKIREKTDLIKELTLAQGKSRQTEKMKERMIKSQSVSNQPLYIQHHLPGIVYGRGHILQKVAPIYSKRSSSQKVSVSQQSQRKKWYDHII